MLLLARVGWVPEFISTAAVDIDADRVPGADGTAIATASNYTPAQAANNWTQPTALNKPVIKRNIINGHSALSFDGTNSWLSSSFLPTTGACTLIFVFKLKSTPSSLYKLAEIKSSGSVFSDFFFSNLGAPYQPYSFISANGTLTNTSGIADALNTNPHILAVTYNGGSISSPSSYTANLDGVSKTVIASSAVSQVAGAQTSLGGDVASGGGTPTSACPMYLSRFIYATTNLGTLPLAAVIKYLRNIYGI